VLARLAPVSWSRTGWKGKRDALQLHVGRDGDGLGLLAGVTR
jgi:hypothetical protein